MISRLPKLDLNETSNTMLISLDRRIRDASRLAVLSRLTASLSWAKDCSLSDGSIVLYITIISYIHIIMYIYRVRIDLATFLNRTASKSIFITQREIYYMCVYVCMCICIHILYMYTRARARARVCVCVCVCVCRCRVQNYTFYKTFS